MKRIIERKTIYNISIITIALVLALMFSAISSEHVNAATYLFVDMVRPKNAEMNTLKCSWSKCRGAAYYKLSIRRDGARKAKTFRLRKKAKSYTFKGLKNNSRYDFSIIVYNSKNKVIGKGFDSAYTGIAIPEFDFEYASPCTGEKICFDINWDDYQYQSQGVRYRNVYVYRKAPDEKWKKIETLSIKDAGSYSDTDVFPGTTYKYKLRTKATVKIKGKKRNVLSRFSEAISLTALDSRGSFTWDYTSASPYQDSMKDFEIECVMGIYNYDVVMDFKNEGKNAKVFQGSSDDEEAFDYHDWVGKEAGELVINEYNIDGTGWEPAKGKVIVSAGHKIALRMSKEDDKMLDMTKDTVVSFIVGYRDIQTNFNIYMYKDRQNGTIRFLNAYYGYPDCGDGDED